MENKVDLTLPKEQAKAIDVHIEGIKEILMSSLVTLTKEERKETLKMGDKTLAFTTKALENAQKYPDLIPGYLSLEEFKHDLEATVALREIQQALTPLNEALSDTLMVAGSEAFQAALVFYNSVKGAAKSGVPGAKTVYDELSKRWPRKKRSASTNEEAE